VEERGKGGGGKLETAGQLVATNISLIVKRERTNRDSHAGFGRNKCKKGEEGEEERGKRQTRTVLLPSYRKTPAKENPGPSTWVLNDIGFKFKDREFRNKTNKVEWSEYGGEGNVVQIHLSVVHDPRFH